MQSSSKRFSQPVAVGKSTRDRAPPKSRAAFTLRCVGSPETVNPNSDESSHQAPPLSSSILPSIRLQSPRAVADATFIASPQFHVKLKRSTASASASGSGPRKGERKGDHDRRGDTNQSSLFWYRHKAVAVAVAAAARAAAVAAATSITLSSQATLPFNLSRELSVTRDLYEWDSDDEPTGNLSAAARLERNLSFSLGGSGASRSEEVDMDTSHFRRLDGNGSTQPAERTTDLKCSAKVEPAGSFGSVDRSVSEVAVSSPTSPRAAYACFSDPSLSLDALFLAAKNIPFAASSLFAASQGWSFQHFDRYQAILHRRRQMATFMRERAKQHPGVGERGCSSQSQASLGGSRQTRSSTSQTNQGTTANCKRSLLFSPPAHDQAVVQARHDVTHSRAAASPLDVSPTSPVSLVQLPARSAPNSTDCFPPALGFNSLSSKDESFATTPSHSSSILSHHPEWPHTMPEELVRQATLTRLSREIKLLGGLEATRMAPVDGLSHQPTGLSNSDDAWQGLYSRRQQRRTDRACLNFTLDAAVTSPVGPGTAWLTSLCPTLLALILSTLDLPSLLAMRRSCRSVRVMLAHPAHQSIWEPQIIFFSSMTQLTGWTRAQWTDQETQAQRDMMKEEEGGRQLEQVHAPPKKLATSSETRLATTSQSTDSDMDTGEESGNSDHNSSLGSVSTNARHTGVASSRTASAHGGQTAAIPDPASSAAALSVIDARRQFAMTSEEERWFLPFSLLTHPKGADRSFRWNRLHSGLTARGALPVAFRMRFQDVAWCHSLSTLALFPYAQTLHTLEIFDSVTLTNDILLPAMLHHLGKAEVARPTADKPTPPLPSSSRWLLTPDTCMSLPHLTSLTLFSCVSFNLQVGLSFLPFYRLQLRHLHLGKCLREPAESELNEVTDLVDGDQGALSLAQAHRSHLGSCTQLLSLHLFGCRSLHPLRIALLHSLAHLQVLDLSLCVLVDNAVLNILGGGGIAPSLRELYLQGCALVSDLRALSRFPALEVLDLSQLPLLKSSSLGMLTHLPVLRHLLLRFNPNLTDTCVASLARMRSLAWVDLNLCVNITQNARRTLKRIKRGTAVQFIDM